MQRFAVWRWRGLIRVRKCTSSGTPSLSYHFRLPSNKGLCAQPSLSCVHGSIPFFHLHYPFSTNSRNLEPTNEAIQALVSKINKNGVDSMEKTLEEAKLMLKGKLKDFETLLRLLNLRFERGILNTHHTFKFCRAWSDDFSILKEVMKVFDKISFRFGKKNCYDMLIASLSMSEHFTAAKFVLETMLSVQCKPSGCTLHPIIVAYVKNGKINEVYELFEFAKTRQITLDIECYNAFMDYLCKQSKLKEAADFLSDMLSLSTCKPDARMYNSLISAACRVGREDGAVSLLDRMRNEGLKPQFGTYTCILRMFMGQGKWEKVYRLLNKVRGIDPVSDYWNYMFVIERLKKDGKREDAIYLALEAKSMGLILDKRVTRELLNEKL
ncbi:pentatricopeptide repeat-containing protein At2g40240, mitochondrial isoform X1 [Amborella trichopoda]|uniref:pentatricopeptide repeat-containing protein At2g40240, mitochondrial isoform X1 n=1 Tax=Amborella trichopoda TaxID=13333 RepID=UPI0009BF31BC|nr:pentatricopeptide repeat-containing protein At2g40240, mitochondrial isoform X1 [Amborella trichopoda]|eukprot:XP_020521399.1 pentatricopeptide repeat-containing protein At2g40240, mitochondrial isoform X1 [Amborella trichopoda]